MVPVAPGKRHQRPQNIRREQNRYEIGGGRPQEGPQISTHFKGDWPQDYRRGVPVQVHGVQCPHPGRTQVDLRRGYANGTQDQSQTNRQEEGIQYVQPYLMNA